MTGKRLKAELDRMGRCRVPVGQHHLVLGQGEEKEGMGGMGWAHRKGGESGWTWGPMEHSEPFIQQRAGEESWLCAAAEWPYAAAQTHPCGCERAFSAKPQTCRTHLAQSQRSRYTLPFLTHSERPLLAVSEAFTTTSSFLLRHITLEQF